MIFDFSKRIEVIYNFLKPLELRENGGNSIRFDHYYFFPYINLGTDSDGNFDPTADIDLEWCSSEIHLLISLAPDGSGGGGYGTWKDHSHSFKYDWKGSLTHNIPPIPENREIYEALYRFFLPALDSRFKVPVKK
jgi:hypothetical protein